jgi:hypothetical protein
VMKLAGQAKTVTYGTAPGTSRIRNAIGIHCSREIRARPPTFARGPAVGVRLRKATARRTESLLRRRLRRVSACR